MKNTLIFDIGMHKGEDSEFYLRKGFSVVSVEADPDLARECRERLADYTQDGSLIIVEKAIVPPNENGIYPEHVTFYKSSVSVCGTVMQSWVERNVKVGVTTKSISVEAMPFSHLIDKYGVPYYLKIDIEGIDTHILQDLSPRHERPAFVSVEAEKENAKAAIKQLDLLVELGYSRFQMTQQNGRYRNQKTPHPPREGKYIEWTFPSAASGLFGNELPKDQWLNYDLIKERLLWFVKRESFWGIKGIQRNWMGRKVHGCMKRLLNDPLPGWFDIHATH